MFDTVKNYLLFIMAVLLVVTASAAWSYRKMYKASDFALDKQNQAITEQNKAAKVKLDAMTADRDAKQEELNKRAAAQEKTDGQAVQGIDDARKRDTAPISVRCVPDAPRRSGGRGSSQETAHAQAGTGDAGASTGVLGQEAERAFKQVIAEVKTLQAAFNSCKATWD